MGTYETAGTLENVHVHIETQPTGDDSMKVGLDLAGLSATADTVADEDTAPSPAVTFATAADYANGIVLGDMVDDSYYGTWIERTVPLAATAATSTWKIRARGEASA